jgi:hypothetical protein
MLMSAPRRVAVFLLGPAWGRQTKPPPYPARKALRPGWPSRQPSPKTDCEALKRTVDRLHETTRAQREALKAAGRSLRIMAREAKTGVPYVAA